MKTAVRHLAGTAFVLAFCACIAVISSLCSAERASLACGRVEVLFCDTLRFVDSTDVLESVFENYGPCIGERLDSVHLAAVEAAVLSREPVSSCQAWTTDDGVLHILVGQRTPAVRFTDGRQSVYADTGGRLFPMTGGYEADVPVGTGRIPEDGDWAVSMVKMLGWMHRNGWNGTISAVESDRSGNISLRACGGERFNIGQPEGFEEKFGLIKKYYDYIVPEKGEGAYKTVNVNFKNQIICRKDT